MKSLFRTKSVESVLESVKKKSLKKTLGALDLVLLGVGGAIGVGIFVLAGVVAARHAGPGVAISCLLAAVVCMCAGLAYAEFASVVPASGSAYTYSYVSLGEFVAWLVACGLVLEYTVVAATVSAGWSGYFVGILKQGGVELPVSLTSVPANGGIVNVPAIMIILFVGSLLYRGTRESVMVNRILVAIKVVIITVFLVVAVPHIKMENYVDFLPFGWNGVLLGSATIFFAYTGFDSLATAVEECKNPKKDMPIGIIVGLLICAAIYILISLALTGISHYSTLDNPEPMARALRENGSNIGSALVGGGALIGMVTVLLVMMYSQSRIFFVMSRDGLIPEAFSRVHKKYGTPHFSCVFVVIAVSLMAGFTPIKILGELSSLGTLFAFFVVSIGVLVLRFTRPDLQRSFKCPIIFIIAPFAIISCGYLIYKLLLETALPALIWFAFGLMVYFAYSRKRSNLNSPE
jgi:APA family basic amino acid/polyamine antiporter